MDKCFSFVRFAFVLLINFVCLLEANTHAQVYPSYPFGQNFYEDGIDGLTADMIEAVREKKLKKCSNIDEVYSPSVLVYPDGKINFVKDFDSLTIEKNKCAYEFTKNILSSLKRWKPAIVNSIEVKAITKFKVIPFLLYHSKKKPEENIITPPVYSNGTEELDKKVRIVLTKDVLVNTTEYNFIVFVISEKGKILDAFLSSNQIDRYYATSLASKIKTLSGDWAPATFNSVPMKWIYIHPIIPSKKNSNVQIRNIRQNIELFHKIYNR